MQTVNDDRLDSAIFELAPVSLWLEDYSALKALFADWRAQGVSDVPTGRGRGGHTGDQTVDRPTQHRPGVGVRPARDRRIEAETARRR